uniref:Uncharacterized protein n=1 Tax=Zooxanthella nutricula TaxID=1333877 RepID=A0A6U6NVU1_9DINO|mmetsp:Transcript_5047/g.15061  ORF Transcript_5047/g.15061 Transcript_5047/m.15061 type:complete len:193 (+) Transcript_5047:71-649(+)
MSCVQWGFPTAEDNRQADIIFALRSVAVVLTVIPATMFGFFAVGFALVDDQNAQNSGFTAAASLVSFILFGGALVGVLVVCCLCWGFRYAAKEKNAFLLGVFGVLDSICAAGAVITAVGRLTQAVSSGSNLGGTAGTAAAQLVQVAFFVYTAWATCKLKGRVEALDVTPPVAASVVGSPTLAQPKADVPVVV